jgi:type IV secretory pathway VirB9-like protein
VDRGTQSVLVQPVKDVPTILLVKAATKDFAETNLSVITDDGSVYSFAVRYDTRPAIWVHNLPLHGKTTMTTYANAILDNPRTIRRIKDKSWNVLAQVNGIYIKGDVIYYQLYFANQSPIDYDVDLLKFFIQDKKKNKGQPSRKRN